MAKSIKCKVVCYNRWGYTCGHKVCNSIAEAKRYAEGMGFSYHIYTEGKLIKQGYC